MESQPRAGSEAMILNCRLEPRSYKNNEKGEEKKSWGVERRRSLEGPSGKEVRNLFQFGAHTKELQGPRTNG